MPRTEQNSHGVMNFAILKVLNIWKIITKKWLRKYGKPVSFWAKITTPQFPNPKSQNSPKLLCYNLSHGETSVWSMCGQFQVLSCQEFWKGIHLLSYSAKIISYIFSRAVHQCFTRSQKQWNQWSRQNADRNFQR